MTALAAAIVDILLCSVYQRDCPTAGGWRRKLPLAVAYEMANKDIYATIVQHMIPSQCPECNSIAEMVTRSIPPWKHERGSGWKTKVECRNCGQFDEWH